MYGFGQTGPSDTGPIQQQLDCLAQGKSYDPATNQCVEVLQPGTAEAAAKAACEAVGGSWNAEGKMCMTGSGPLLPPGQEPPPPPAEAKMPWQTIGIIGAGLGVAYLLFRSR